MIDWDDAVNATGYEVTVWNETIGWIPLPAEPFTLTCPGLDPSATNPVCAESTATVDGLTHRDYYFFLRSRNASGTSGWSSGVLVSYTEPEFLETVPDQTYTTGQPIPTLELPEATGRDAPLTYSISPALPAGLTFNATARTITGTPTADSATTMYTYLATDASTDPDRDRLTFTITVEQTIPPPGVPTGLTVTKLSNETVVIDWDNAANATGYEVAAYDETTTWTPLPTPILTLACSGLDVAATTPDVFRIDGDRKRADGPDLLLLCEKQQRVGDIDLDRGRSSRFQVPRLRHEIHPR